LSRFNWRAIQSGGWRFYAPGFIVDCPSDFIPGEPSAEGFPQVVVQNLDCSSPRIEPLSIMAHVPCDPQADPQDNSPISHD
jgi:hypothetical protein